MVDFKPCWSVGICEGQLIFLGNVQREVKAKLYLLGLVPEKLRFLIKGGRLEKKLLQEYGQGNAWPIYQAGRLVALAIMIEASHVSEDREPSRLVGCVKELLAG